MKQITDPELLNKFSENINAISKSKNINQAAVAKALNVSTTTVARWYNAVCLPTIDKLFELDELFNVDLHVFFGYKSNDEISEEGKELFFAALECMEDEFILRLYEEHMEIRLEE